MTEQAKPRSNEYPTFEPGVYRVSRIEFFTQDQNGAPIFVTQQGRDGNPFLTARYRTFTSDDKQGPPGSITPDGLPLFVHAFGADPAKLPDDVLHALSVAAQLINTSDKEVDVVVTEYSKGWISRVLGATLPEGDYRFSKDRISSLDNQGNPTWRKTKYGESMIITLKVVSNADNTPTAFVGSEMQLWLGRPTVLRALMPDVYGSMLGTVEEEGERFKEYLANPKFHLVGTVGDTGRGNIGVIKSSLHAIPANTEMGSAPVQEDEPEYLQYMYTAIADGVVGNAFDNKGALTDAGKSWCRTNLRPIAQEHDLPSNFNEMTLDHVKHYLAGIERTDLMDKMDGLKDTYDEEPW